MCINLLLLFFLFIFGYNQDDNVDVTSEPVEQEVSVGSPLQHTTNKNHQNNLGTVLEFRDDQIIRPNETKNQKKVKINK